MWILRILGPIKFCKGPIKNSNGPLKFGNLHVFEWDMGHWPILRAHHHFGLGLSLKKYIILKSCANSVFIRSNTVCCFFINTHRKTYTHYRCWDLTHLGQEWMIVNRVNPGYILHLGLHCLLQ